MFGIENYFLFLAACLVLNFTPGPDILYVTTRGVTQGRAIGLVSALAISTGGLVHTLAAALGLSVVLSYSATAFAMVKWAGALYLIYLGVRTWLDTTKTLIPTDFRPDPLIRIYSQGVLVSVLNPKVTLFFLAFLPQFTDPSSGSFAGQMLILGLTFCTTATMVNSLVAMVSSWAGKWLQKGRAGRIGAWISGGVFIAMGIGLAASESR